jgi:hypothetical protein
MNRCRWFKILIGAVRSYSPVDRADISIWDGDHRTIDLILARGLRRKKEYARLIVRVIDGIYRRSDWHQYTAWDAVSYVGWDLE